MQKVFPILKLPISYIYYNSPLHTDYVFDGEKTDHYKEEDQTNPHNAYGVAKFKAKETVQSILDNYYILRTSWVFGQCENGFVSTMKRLAKER